MLYFLIFTDGTFTGTDDTGMSFDGTEGNDSTRALILMILAQSYHILLMDSEVMCNPKNRLTH